MRVGLAQRAASLEPLGLFRFSGQPLKHLILALDDQLLKLGSADAIKVKQGNADYECFIPPYQMHFHTMIDVTTSSLAEIHRGQLTRMPFLRRLFLENVETGEKVFLFKRNAFLHMAQVLPLFAALWRIAPANLLIARAADREHPPGTIEVVMPGLFAGYVSRFSPYFNISLNDEMVATWTTLCRQVLLLASHPQDSAPDPRDP